MSPPHSGRPTPSPLVAVKCFLHGSSLTRTPDHVPLSVCPDLPCLVTSLTSMPAEGGAKGDLQYRVMWRPSSTTYEDGLGVDVSVCSPTTNGCPWRFSEGV